MSEKATIRPSGRKHNILRGAEPFINDLEALVEVHHIGFGNVSSGG